jgi:hypothetical protein
MMYEYFTVVHAPTGMQCYAAFWPAVHTLGIPSMGSMRGKPMHARTFSSSLSMI